MDVGKRIKARRKEIGMSAEEVAAIIGVSPATVYRYESANIMNMKTDKLLPIAEALNTTPAYLMGWTDDPANNNTDSSLAIHSRTRDISDQATSKCAIVHNNHRASISWALPLANAYAIAVEPTQRNVCKLLDIGHVIPDTLAIPYQRPEIDRLICAWYADCRSPWSMARYLRCDRRSFSKLHWITIILKHDAPAWS